MKETERRSIDRLVATLERLNLEDYIEYIGNRRRLILSNLLYGMLRGVGFSFGFTVLGAIALVLLQHLMRRNMPLIGGFIAEVIDAIEART